MFDTVHVKAGFANLNIKAGKTVLQFELDPVSAYLIPTLARFTGTPVRLAISTDQQVLFVNEDTGEVSDTPEFEVDEGDGGEPGGPA